MSKNRTMEAKNAKVVQYAIAGGKTALAADIYNAYMAGQGYKMIDGVGLYVSHSKFMQQRPPKKRAKWIAK